MIRLEFLDPEQRELYRSQADPRLIRIVRLAQLWLRVTYGVATLTVTSFYRPGNRHSPHAWMRAIDLRSRSLPKTARAGLADYLNDLLIYSILAGKRRYRVAYYKPDAPGGPHLHLQVPPVGERMAIRATDSPALRR